MSKISTIEQGIEDFRQGKMVILIDDEDRENEGDLCIAAEKITPEAINFMATHGRGLICLPMAAELVDHLQLPQMATHNQSPYGTAFTVSIEAASGVTTGISAKDRAHTIQVAIAESAKPNDVIMPGHIFPLRAKAGGVLVRPGQTEGSVDLARLAGLRSAAVICEIMNEDGSMSRMEDLKNFGRKHNINLIKIKDLITHRMRHENLIEEVATTRLPTEVHGDLTLKVFSNHIDSFQHLALLAEPRDKTQACLVRLHSECLTGDVFGSSRCDCGWQLNASLEKISQEGGILLYMRGHEGRGIGLANKIKAYVLQDQGMDTVEANHQLGFSADQRNYGMGAQILRHLGVQRMRLLTNNPQKIEGLRDCGIDIVGREPLEMQLNDNNDFYLHTKRDKLGHLFTFNEALKEA
ncbi:MAG: bifunctional 3,4-dihydroxy-2-butanone-4-phosphate synthase/GTP cyclohydrolase II [Gammaproteobacteria bacterium]